ncbi:MAG: hypothetical protein AB7I18_09765 [Candidatus Berkiella sp.]
MLDYSSSHLLDFSEYPDWLHALKEGKNEYVLQNYLRENKHLTHLSFFSSQLSDADLRIILTIVQKCPHIQSLDLANNCFTKEGLLFLAQRLPKMKLKELDISGNYTVGLDAIHALTRAVKSSDLEILKMNRISLHGGCDSIFSDLKESKVSQLEINTAELNPLDAQDIATHLVQYEHLQSLDLSSNALGNEGVTIITREASKLNLRHLDISYNQHTSGVLATLGKQLRDTTLTTVRYDGIPLPATPFAIVHSAVLFNQQYNQTGQLALAALDGEQLKLQENEFGQELPPEMAETVGEHATQSNTQKRAFMQGWSAKR